MKAVGHIEGFNSFSAVEIDERGKTIKSQMLNVKKNFYVKSESRDRIPDGCITFTYAQIHFRKVRIHILSPGMG